MSTSDRAPPPPRAMDYFVETLEEVDYESDTQFPGWEDHDGKIPQWRDVSPVQTMRMPCPLPELSTSE
ncbi:hypothetical protein Plhal703r1_c05g0028481 [Plasmopara halstedii]